jgi:hypothetical protein
MIDGPTVVSDRDKTDANKALMQSYMDDLLHGRRDIFAGYFDGNNYIQHNPWAADNLTGLLAGRQALAKEGKTVKYQRVEKVLGEVTLCWSSVRAPSAIIRWRITIFTG